MKPKEKELLLLLYKNRGNYMTNPQLAGPLDLSERTIRTYVHALDLTVRENGAQIEAKQGKGYRLKISQPAQFEAFLQQLDKKAINSSYVPRQNTGQERQTYILSKLLLENEHIIMDRLPDALFISRSTLSKDLAAIKELLKPYHLSLKSRPNYGTWIDGEESDKRDFIINYFFRQSKFTSLKEYMDHSGYFDDIPVESLIMVIMEETEKSHLRLSDMEVQNILLHLALCIKRLKKGLKLNVLSMPEDIFSAQEFQTAQNIICRLEKTLGSSFPFEETAYLTVHLAAKDGNLIQLRPEDRQDLKKHVCEVLAKMDEETGLQLHDDEKLIEPLLDHIIPMRFRLQRNIQQGNPLTEEILKDHRDIFQLTLKYFSQLPELAGLEISDDEWAYLTIHIMAALERADNNRKLQVLIICASGYGTSQLLKNRIEKEFSDSLHIVSETGYFNINYDILQGIDLIISSVNMGSVIFKVPFIHVSPFLTEEDIQKIRTYIRSHQKSGAPEMKKSGLPRPELEELYDAFFDSSRFFVFDKGVSKEEVMDALIESVSVGESEEFSRHLQDQIKLRQKLGTIVFSDTITVPHPAMPLSEKGRFAVGLIPSGLSWDDEYKNIQMVFLLSPSYSSNEGSHHLLSGIVNLIDQGEVQRKMLEHPDYSQFRSEFINLM